MPRGYNPGLRKVVSYGYNCDREGAGLERSVDIFYNGINHYQAVRPTADTQQSRPNSLTLTADWYDQLSETWAQLNERPKEAKQARNLKRFKVRGKTLKRFKARCTEKSLEGGSRTSPEQADRNTCACASPKMLTQKSKRFTLALSPRAASLEVCTAEWIAKQPSTSTSKCTAPLSGIACEKSL